MKFVEPNIAHFKAKGNRVVVAEGSLVSDVLAIEIMKTGKFVIAGHELPKEEPARKSAAITEQPPLASYRSNLLGAGPEAAAKASTTAATTAPAQAEPVPTSPPPAAEAPASVAEPAASNGGYDYVFSVNTSTKAYAPKTNDYPATYSFSVTAASGEIIYIKALSGGDLKRELATTIAEVACLLL